MGEIDDYTGKLNLGHNVQIGYFAQNQASLLDESLTVYQTVDDVTPSELKSKIKDLLGAFMFSGDDIDKRVKVLSGGERTRLAMIKLLLSPVNLLILDEPTNHLDLKTKDILKNALIDFDGTLIVVSHDRDFLSGLVKKVYEFGNKRVKEHLEDIHGLFTKEKDGKPTGDRTQKVTCDTDIDFRIYLKKVIRHSNILIFCTQTIHLF